MTAVDPLDPVCRVAAALEQLGVEYIVCGSLASTHHGEPRTTHDADLVADLRLEHVGPLVQILGAGFYADRVSMREAIATHSSFNVIDHATGIKVDVFVLRDRAFSRVEMTRGVRLSIPGRRALRVASAEDTLLTKLEWYRKGGEVSERQWRDVKGICKAQWSQLDTDYLDRWADALGIADLLTRVIRECDPGG